MRRPAKSCRASCCASGSRDARPCCSSPTRSMRQFSAGATAAALTLALGQIARAQSYPTRPVRFILPFAAGGVADVTARLTADKLGEKLGQRFVIENQPGPGGIIAGRAIAAAAPD